MHNVLSDLKTLASIAKENNIPVRTLQDRLKNLIEGEDYLKLGKRMPTILTPTGERKILNK